MAAASAIAFAVGFAWQISRLAAAATGADSRSGRVVDSKSRVAALEAVDEAVTARFENRHDDALAALRRARAADHTLPAIDLMSAAIALDDGDSSSFAPAIRAAGRDPDQAANASLLLGLHSWLYSGANDQTKSAGIESALSHFAEATAEDPFNGTTYFFWGDVLRRFGRHEEGSQRAVQASLRVNPWDSFFFLSLKGTLAAKRAGVADSQLPLDPAQKAVAELAEAVAQGSDAVPAVADLLRFVPAAQAVLLASDPAFAGHPAMVSALTKAGSLPGLPPSVVHPIQNSETAP